MEAKLPEGLPPGEVEIILHLSETEVPLTQQELDEAFAFRPTSGAEIATSSVVGAWADLGITDSAAWVEEVRRYA
ncbi:MAG: hypothetical protein ABI947_12150 [Chloroflexota bacterium]